MNRFLVKFISATSALFFGTGLASVYALTETDFTNTGIVLSAPAQFENNGSNNTGTVLVQPKGLSIEKVADGSQLSTPTKAGEVINYTITLDNLGLLPLTGVTLNDSIIPAADLSLSSGDTNNDNILDGNEVWVFTGSYAITQADIDNFGGGDGDIDNLVTVTTNELDPLSDTAFVAITQGPDFTVSKQVDKAVVNTPSLLTYTIDIKNTGNQTLTGVALVDNLPDGSLGTLTGPATDAGIANALDVGEIWTYTGTYSATQSDIDTGALLTNEVSVTAVEMPGVTRQDDATTSIELAPQLLVTKTVDTQEIAQPTTLTYSISIENTGNATLTNVTPIDTLPDGSNAVLVGPISDTGIIGSLDVGEVWEYTTTYDASQADIDASVALVNTIAVSTDETLTEIFTDTATTNIATAPAFTVAKAVDTSTLSAPGLLNYVITIENSGNVSLSNVLPIDTLPDGSNATLLGPTNDSGLVGQLDVGESWEFTAVYNVSQAEIDQGLSLINRVDVTSDETADAVVSDTAQTTVSRSPSFTVEKTVDTITIAEPSDLNYEISVVNTGNTSLTNIVVNDTLPDGSSAIVSGPVVDTGVNGVLDVGETWVFTAQYGANQIDIDAGLTLINSVDVATAEAGSQRDTASTAINQAPAITLVKSTNDTGFTTIGDTLTYTLQVVNSGNVVLSNISVTDLTADVGSLTCALPIPFTLQPTEQLNCTVTRTATIDDIGTTSITNQASVSATDPLGNEISDDSDMVVVPLTRIPPVAIDDAFESPVSAVAVTLEGAQNDTDANGDLDPTSVHLVSVNASDLDGDGDNDQLVVPNEGTWLVNDVNGEVTFTPEAGFTADPTPIVYTVNDATELVSNEATLSIDYPQSAPIAEDDFQQNLIVASPTNPTLVNVLADNGSGVDRDPENDIDVTRTNFVHPDAIDTDGDGDNDSLTVAGEGEWILDNATGVVTFTPIAGFLLDPTPIFYTIEDFNGLLSNEAKITIDYPQTAPIAIDDEKLNQPLAQPVTLALLANDSDPENNIDNTSVRLIDPASGNSVLELTVIGEGAWVVDVLTGDVTFFPEPGFIENPTPVMYTVKDSTDLESNVALVTVTYELPATIEGIVWLDSDRDGLVGANEELKVNWTLRILDAQGNEVATTTTDANGYYRVEGLVPGEYTVEFYNESGVFMDSQTTNGPIGSGDLVNLPLRVDPGGVIYDSVSRQAVAGVTLNLINGSGQQVDELCLRENQQSQITEADGLYSFNVNLGAHPTCLNGEIYRIVIADVPESYRAGYSNIIRQAGAEGCGDATLGCAVSETFDAALVESNCTVDTIPNSDACEVQVQPDAPQLIENTQYFVEFFLEFGDQNIVFNHIPIDSRANDAQILLSKTVDQRTVSRGSIAGYTINAENTNEVPALDIVIVDNPPPNFALVEESVRLIRAGADEVLGTDDDTVTNIALVGSNPMQLGAIDLDPLETVQITYLMRVGVGVVAGDYTNTASASGPNGVASNSVSASVTVVPDPVLEQATLVGKVFNDRDEDGSQDPADATGVVLRSDFYGWNSLLLPALPGRDSVSANPSDRALVVNMPVSNNNAFSVSTQEGTKISVDHQGTISEAHIGEKAQGLTGQDIRVCTQYTVDVPTPRSGYGSAGGEPTDVLQIVIQNYGVNELGIPGARLATVTGLLIETDAYGRYSIPDVDAGTTGIGQNFVLKVDPATLPQGASFTTENPYVLRIVNSSLNKINFGVKLPGADPYVNQTSPLCQTEANDVATHSVEVLLGSVFFNTDRYDVRADQQGIVADIVKKLREYGGGTILIEAHTDSIGDYQYNLDLAERRAETIRRVLEEKLGKHAMESVTVDVNPEAYQEQEQ